MTLDEMLKRTDALTYINSLKVTLLELKAEFSSIEEQVEYITQACERSKKLMRRADNQYRLVAKLVNNKEITTSLEGELNLAEAMENLEDIDIQELIKNVD